MNRKRKYLPHSLFVLILMISGCRNDKIDIEGQWLNFSNYSKEDFVLLSFGEDKVRSVSGDNIMKSWSYNISESELNLTNKNGVIERFKYEFNTMDTVFLIGDQGSEFSLVKFSEIRKGELSRGRLRFDLVKKSLLDHSWVSSIFKDGETSDPIRQSLLEFKKNGKVLFYDYNNESYMFSNVLDWHLIYLETNVVLLLRGMFNNYLLADLVEEELISGMTFSTELGNIQSAGINIFKFLPYSKQPVDESLDLFGNWRIKGEKQFGQPKELFFHKSSQGLKVNFIFESGQDIYGFDLNLFQDKILLNALENKISDVIHIIEFTGTKMTLRWKNLEPMIFEKYDSDYFIN